MTNIVINRLKMKKNNYIQMSYYFIFLFILFLPVLVFGKNQKEGCPELPYLTTDYINEHKGFVEKQCMSKGSLDENCFNLSKSAYEKFMNCFEDCGGYSDKGCENLSMLGDCSFSECTTKLDNDCAKKCKNYLFFNYSNKANAENDSEHGEHNNDNNREEFENSNMIGSSVIANEKNPCVGEIPKSARLCPDDSKDVLYYTEKQLVDSCSSPEGSKPKCEYVCKTEYLDNGICKEEGFFKKILNWFGELF
jgi:hypothetical protein